MTDALGPHRAPLNTQPLIGRVDPSELREFQFEVARQTGKPPPGYSAGGGVAAAIVGVTLFGVATGVIWMLYACVGALVAAIVANFGVEPSLDGLFTFAVVAAPVTVAVFAFLVWRASRRHREMAYRVSRFAAANGYTFTAHVDDPELPGMIFRGGIDRHSCEVLRAQRPRAIEIGNYQFAASRKTEYASYAWSYAMITLRRPLPHIVLDAVGNNSMFGSNLPAGIARSQRVSLEGDFDRHFTLYCPEGYEADALYLFTPDIMGRFIDHAAGLDVEIIDDRLFLYSTKPLVTPDPATWQRVMATIDAITEKLERWER